MEEYKCRYCGKECKSKLSESCHERLCKSNPNKVDTTYLSRNAINTNTNLVQKYKDYKLSLNKVQHACICKNCGKTFYIEDFENRKSFPMCCSSFCSHSLSGKANSKGVKQVRCNKCGNSFEVNKHSSNSKFICNACRQQIKEQQKQEKILRKIKKNAERLALNKAKKSDHKRILSETSIQKLREAGKKSAQKQSEIRRSKNEIEFCRLCEKYFDNVEHNKPIFNGWDSDIIIHDIRFAVLWNGKVHYEPIFGEANYNRVINRDKIKLKEIHNCGYVPYVIKDMGKHKDDFVQKKFDEFIEYLKENDYL